MTQSIPTTLLGTRAFCRRLLNADVRMPLNLGTFPDAAVKGNLANGRSGQRMVVDGLNIYTDSDTNALTVALRDSANNDASGVDLQFQVTSFTAAESVQRLMKIRKFGYVPDPTGNSEREAANFLGSFVSNAGSQAASDVTAIIRYLGRDEASNNGVKRGAWGSTLLVAPTTLIPAPGVGFFNRIHTLIVICCGSNAGAGESVVIGANATPSNAPIRRFFSGPGVNGFHVEHIATDTDIATPENTPIAVSGGASFLGRASVIVGVEIARMETANFVNMTGAPQ